MGVLSKGDMLRGGGDVRGRDEIGRRKGKGWCKRGGRYILKAGYNNKWWDGWVGEYVCVCECVCVGGKGGGGGDW